MHDVERYVLRAWYSERELLLLSNAHGESQRSSLLYLKVDSIGSQHNEWQTRLLRNFEFACKQPRGSFWGSPTPENRLNNVLSLDSFPQLDWSRHYDSSNGRHIKLELEFGVLLWRAKLPRSVASQRYVIWFGLRHSMLPPLFLLPLS